MTKVAASRGQSTLELPDDGLLGVVVRLELAVTQALERITAELGLTLERLPGSRRDPAFAGSAAAHPPRSVRCSVARPAA